MNDLQQFFNLVQTGLQRQAKHEMDAAVELAPWYDAPQVHRASEFGGNVAAATIADKLFARWSGLVNVAEAAGWEDEKRNAAHVAAWCDLNAFRHTYNDDAHHVTGKRVVAIGDQYGVTAYDAEGLR